MIGTRINNYEITGLIGAGGMGNVYQARHPMIDRGAAIKVLHAELASDRGLVTRFFNEARAANAIRHPNIIDIIDVGLLPGTERPYLMMELLEGENLAQRIARIGQMGVAQAIELAHQTASALAAAHRKGIIHRDLKPENLFIVPHGTLPGREVVKVLDFGIAKLRSEIGDGKFQTQTGTLMGTPPYMSPEQCRGVSTEIDFRTDVYALGIILFEMLCGAPPFMAAGVGEILVMHIQRPPPAPRTLNPAVPEALEAMILKALAKTADERFATMGDFETALAGMASGVIVVAAAAASSASAPAVAPLPAERPTSVVPFVPPERTTTPRPTTTFGASTGTISADLEAIRHRRSPIPIVIAAVIGVAGVIFALSGSRQAREPGTTSSESASKPPTSAPINPASPAVVPPSAASPPSTAESPRPGRGGTSHVGAAEARPSRVTAPADGGAPAASPPPSPRKPARSKPASSPRADPEKW